MFHSPDYRRIFANNLRRELPRIPLVASAADFRKFRDVGAALGRLHLGYENAPRSIWKGTIEIAPDAPDDDAARFRVEKMRHPGRGDSRDRSTVLYNDWIALRGIPEAAWEYEVSGRPAISWVMQRQGVRTDSGSKIVGDSNRYASETAGDSRYPLELLMSVVRLSIETMRLVGTLPKFDPKTAT